MKCDVCNRTCTRMVKPLDRKSRKPRKIALHSSCEEAMRARKAGKL